MIDYESSSGLGLEVNVNVRSHCFGSVWKQYEQEVGNYVHLSCLSCDFGLKDFSYSSTGILDEHLGLKKETNVLPSFNVLNICILFFS